MRQSEFSCEVGDLVKIRFLDDVCAVHEVTVRIRTVKSRNGKVLEFRYGLSQFTPGTFEEGQIGVALWYEHNQKWYMCHVWPKDVGHVRGNTRTHIHIPVILELVKKHRGEVATY